MRLVPHRLLFRGTPIELVSHHAFYRPVQFLVGGAGGVAIGLLVGSIVARVHRITRTVPVVANTVSLLTPFASYLLADLVGASGILAVVATGMYAARTVPKVLGPAIRQQIAGTWTVVTFMLESLVFILVGLELPYVARALNRFPLPMLLREAALVSLCVVLVRLAWVMPSAYIFRGLGRWFRRSKEPLPPWRWVLFIGWAGLRGADSLVLALSLPLLTASGERFPARDQIIFISFSVIFITLVVQGPTLAPFARWLCIGADEDEGQEDAHARLAASEAGLKHWRIRRSRAHHIPRSCVTSSSGIYSVHDGGQLGKQNPRERARGYRTRPRPLYDHSTTAPSHEAAAIDDHRAVEYRRVRSAMLRAEQQAILDLRDRGVIADDVMRNIQRDLDLESMLLETSEPVVGTAYEATVAIDAASR